MIEKLRQLISEAIQPTKTPNEVGEDALALAATALMLQLAGIDREEDPRELDLILATAREQYGLSETASRVLLENAREQAGQATSLFEFTGLLNDHLDHDQRMQLLERLWRIALADRHLDKYEEHLIRRVADLMHLSPKEFIACKLRAQETT